MHAVHDRAARIREPAKLQHDAHAVPLLPAPTARYPPYKRRLLQIRDRTGPQVRREPLRRIRHPHQRHQQHPLLQGRRRQKVQPKLSYYNDIKIIYNIGYFKESRTPPTPDLSYKYYNTDA